MPTNVCVTHPTNILMDEKDLLKRISQGDEAAFTEIFHYYGRRIWLFVTQKTKSETIADEIVQEVFLKLWQKKDTVTEIDNFSSFVYTIATNKTYDYFRKVARDSRKLEGLWRQLQEVAACNTVEETIDFHESMEIINEAIDQLPPQRKKIYLLNRMEGLSYEEIARELDISKNTVSNQLVEATKFIRAYIKGAKGTAIIFMILSTRFFP